MIVRKVEVDGECLTLDSFDGEARRRLHQSDVEIRGKIIAMNRQQTEWLEADQDDWPEYLQGGAE